MDQTLYVSTRIPCMQSKWTKFTRLATDRRPWLIFLTFWQKKFQISVWLHYDFIVLINSARIEVWARCSGAFSVLSHLKVLKSINAQGDTWNCSKVYKNCSFWHLRRYTHPSPRNFWNIFCQHPWLLALIVIINVCALCTSALCRRYKLSTARVVEFWIDAARSL